MVQTIAEELHKYTQNVVTHSTFGPDIVFQIQTNENQFDWYAIEIETGSQARNYTDLELKTLKNTSNEKPKYKEWFYIVTDRHQKPTYEKYHTTSTRTEAKEKIKGLFR